MHQQRVAAVIPARNEQKFIGRTLAALLAQYTRPSKIVVVDDGSQDATAEIAASAGSEVISMPDRGHSGLGSPVLASVINRGLRRLQDLGYGSKPNDRVLVLGADHILPPHYLMTIMDIMDASPNIAICSGQIAGERSVVPRGSGRIVKADFWLRNGFRYPENYGFETYLVVKAQQQGYSTRVLNNLVTQTLRKTGRNYKKSTYLSYGKSLKALGYSKLYSAARIGLVAMRNPLGGFYMLQGRLSRDVQPYDPELRSYLHSIQHKRIRRYIINPVKAFTSEAA